MATLSKSDFKLARSCITKLYYKEKGYPQNDDENPYLAMLAEGGYMVEQLARMMFPEGIELTHGDDAAEDWAATARHLAADRVTLFEATLLSGRKLVRVDILVKRGNHFDLIEVKSKSTRGEDGERSKDDDDTEDGPQGPFRSKTKSKGVHKLLKSWIPYLEDVGFQTQVLRELFPGASVTPFLLMVDKSKTTSVDGLPGMFRIERGSGLNGRLDVRFVGDSAAIPAGEFLTKHDITSEVDELGPSIAAAATGFEELYTDEGVTRAVRALDWRCKDCEFRVRHSRSPSGYDECWGELAKPLPHLFDLYKLGSYRSEGEPFGNSLIRAGKTSLYDVDPQLLVKKDGSARKDSVRQRIQLEHTRSGTTWVDAALHRELDALGWPIHFVDFETSAIAVPYHAGMRPYSKVAFQWSCHTLDRPGARPVHSEWLNAETFWPNAEFVRTLREAVGTSGRILTWSSYERTVLKDLRDQIGGRVSDAPELIAWLDAVIGDKEHASRLFDLNALCLQTFFHPGMGGRTSIKVVLDALWRHDPVMRSRCAEWRGEPLVLLDGLGPYEGLPPVEVAGSVLNVADGMGAMRAYQAMLYGAERDDPVLVETYRQLLLRYCELDTLAMVLIWDHWRRIAPAH